MVALFRFVSSFILLQAASGYTTSVPAFQTALRSSPSTFAWNNYARLFRSRNLPSAEKTILRSRNRDFRLQSSLPLNDDNQAFFFPNDITDAAVATKPASAPAPKPVMIDRKTCLAIGMAFLTGIADIMLYLKYKTFATMMTGNSMWMASALVDGSLSRAAYYVCVIFSYLVGVAAFRRLDLTFRKKSLNLCAMAVAGLFVGSDLVYVAMNASKWIPVMMLACGFGIINSVGSEVSGTLTFVITGHMTKLTNQFVDRFSKRKGRKRLTDADKKAVAQNLAVIGGFVGGVAVACLLQAKAMFASKIFSLLGLSFGALFYWLDMESFGGAWWLRKGKKMCDLDDDGELCDIPVLTAVGAALNATTTMADFNATEALSPEMVASAAAVTIGVNATGDNGDSEEI